jgi:hypothetical protein
VTPGGANGGHRAARSPWGRPDPAPLCPVRRISHPVDKRRDRFDLPAVDPFTIDLMTILTPGGAKGLPRQFAAHCGKEVGSGR